MFVVLPFIFVHLFCGYNFSPVDTLLHVHPLYYSVLSARRSATGQKGPTASRNKNPTTTRKKKRVISQAFVSSSEDESGDDSRKRLESVEEEEKKEGLSGMEEGETSLGQDVGPVAKMQSESSASSSSESESEAR